jgi:hypothetical protein
MADNLLSSQIYLSRDSIREQISTLTKEYLELENVDLTKSSFLTFLIDTVSTLTGNLLFYQLSTYREFFLTKAQLPESILNLSAFLGYNTVEATPARVNVLMTIPFGFDDPLVQFQIADGFIFNADGDIEFRTYYTTTIEVTGNASATVVVQEDNKRYNLPVDINTDSFSFVLPLLQVKEVSQEFQIDSDTQQYQFVTLDVPVDGEVASLEVQIQEPGSAGYTTWTEFESLFLMSNSDKGYVSRRTDTGRRLTFGNDLTGIQPTPGSTVLVTVQTTEGVDGNVIAGSIRDGERIYVQTLSGINQVVSYNVINSSPAFNGKDEESLEEIRKNSIAAISTLSRLVTENDYQNINVVIENSPFAQNALPVLKRSDLQVNEIELFTGILFGTGTEEIDNLVPTRNAAVTLPVTQTRLERNTEITIGSDTYYTMFDVGVDLLNTVGIYEYTIFEIEVIPALETSFTSTYDIYADKLEVIRDGDLGIFKLYYQSSEVDSNLATCKMVVQSSGSTKTMINDATAGYFIYTFNPYTNIALNEQTYEFTISDPSNNPVAKYSNKVTFRADVSTYMRSNIVQDGTSMIIYDVPVIEKEYYDGINQRDFELEVLQTIISTADLASNKMLTDFTNLKFTNTYGVLQNMQLNEATISSVLDIVETLPTGCADGDRFILAPCTGNAEYQDNIIKCLDSSASIFLYEEPISDSIVYISSKGENYIYSDRGWIPLPQYTVPLQIELEVFRSSTFSGTLSALLTTIRETLYDAFKDRFGTNATIYRSEIIDVIQEIDGISHCNIRKPETGIFFNFELQNLTEDQLLNYGPEYVFFTEDTITVRIS